MDLAGGIQGNVVVEITIDEQGNGFKPQSWKVSDQTLTLKSWMPCGIGASGPLLATESRLLPSKMSTITFQQNEPLDRPLHHLHNFYLAGTSHRELGLSRPLWDIVIQAL
jgi:hypothetical protein